MLFRSDKISLKYFSKISIISKLRVFCNMNRVRLTRLKNSYFVGQALSSKFKRGVPLDYFTLQEFSGRYPGLFSNLVRDKWLKTALTPGFVSKSKLNFYWVDTLWGTSSIFSSSPGWRLIGDPVNYKYFDSKALFLKYNLHHNFFGNFTLVNKFFLIFRDLIFFSLLFFFFVIIFVFFVLNFFLIGVDACCLNDVFIQGNFYSVLLNSTCDSAYWDWFTYYFIFTFLGVIDFFGLKLLADLSFFNIFYNLLANYNVPFKLDVFEFSSVSGFSGDIIGWDSDLHCVFLFYATLLFNVISDFVVLCVVKQEIIWYFFAHFFFIKFFLEYVLYSLNLIVYDLHQFVLPLEHISIFTIFSLSFDLSALYSCNIIGVSKLNGVYDLHMWPSDYYWLPRPLESLWFFESSYLLYNVLNEFFNHQELNGIFSLIFTWLLIPLYFVYIIILYIAVVVVFRKLFLMADVWNYLIRWFYLVDEDLKLLSVEPVSQLLGLSTYSSKRVISKFKLLSNSSYGLGSNYYNTYQVHAAVGAEETFAGYTGFLNTFPTEFSVLHHRHFYLNNVFSKFSFKKFKNFLKRKFGVLDVKNYSFSDKAVSVMRTFYKNLGFNFFLYNVFTKPKFYLFGGNLSVVSFINSLKNLSSEPDNAVRLSRRKIYDYSFVNLDHELEHSVTFFDSFTAGYKQNSSFTNSKPAFKQFTKLTDYADKSDDSIFDVNYRSYLPEWDQDEVNNAVVAQNLNSYFFRSRLKLFNFSNDTPLNEFSFLMPEFNYDDRLEYTSPEDNRFFVLFDEDGNFLPEETDEDDQAYDFGDNLNYEDGYLSDLSDFYDDEIEEESLVEGLSDKNQYDSYLTDEGEPFNLDDEDDEDELMSLSDIMEKGWGQEFDYNTDYRTNYSSNQNDVRPEYSHFNLYREGIHSNLYEDLSDMYFLNSFLSSYENFFLFPTKRVLSSFYSTSEAIDHGWFQRSAGLGRFLIFYLKYFYKFFFSHHRLIYLKFFFLLVFAWFCLFYLWWYLTLLLVNKLTLNFLGSFFLVSVNYTVFFVIAGLMTLVVLLFFRPTFVFLNFFKFFSNFGVFFLTTFGFISFFFFIYRFFFRNTGISLENSSNVLQPSRLIQQVFLSNLGVAACNINNFSINLLSNFGYRVYFKYFLFNLNSFYNYPTKFNPLFVLFKRYLISLDWNSVTYFTHYNNPGYCVNADKVDWYLLADISRWWSFKLFVNNLERGFLFCSGSKTGLRLNAAWVADRRISSYKFNASELYYYALVSSGTSFINKFKFKLFESLIVDRRLTVAVDRTDKFCKIDFNVGRENFSRGVSPVADFIFKDFLLLTAKTPKLRSRKNFYFFSKLQDISVRGENYSLYNDFRLVNGALTKFLYSSLTLPSPVGLQNGTLPHINKDSRDTRCNSDFVLYGDVIGNKGVKTSGALSGDWGGYFGDYHNVSNNSISSSNSLSDIFGSSKSRGFGVSNNFVDLSTKDKNFFFLSNNINYNYGFDLLRFKNLRVAGDFFFYNNAASSSYAYDKDFFYFNFFGHETLSSKSFINLNPYK